MSQIYHLPWQIFSIDIEKIDRVGKVEWLSCFVKYDKYMQNLRKRWLMPCPSTGSKIVCTGPSFLCQTKLFVPGQTFCARPKDDLY